MAMAIVVIMTIVIVLLLRFRFLVFVFLDLLSTPSLDSLLAVVCRFLRCSKFEGEYP